MFFVAMGFRKEIMSLSSFVQDFFTPSVAPSLVVKTCGECGITFAVPKEFDEEKQKEGSSGKGWYCPNGHARIYCETKESILKRELAREKQRTDQLAAEAKDLRKRKAAVERSLTATRGVVTRIKNRVKNGVCPCCNRYFANLHRHMTTQHPGFVPDKDIG